MADYLNIAGRVRTTASDGVAMEAQEVKDLNQNKSQQEINADVQTELGDRYTKEETYSKEQLDNLITTPDENYVSVVATGTTTAVTDVLPATGEANTIYRVGNWNGTQYDPTMYALYSWNGSEYVCLAVRSFVGEVYDISVNHPDGQGNPTPYADLAAALGTDGANIPADIRRGGMRIQFIKGTVQSSDNKYEQYRLTTQAFSITEAHWAVVGLAKFVPANDWIYAVTDSEGRVVLGIKENGKVFANGLSSTSLVVAKDGSGDYSNLSLAIIETYGKKNVVITIMPGTYDIIEEMKELYGDDFWDNYDRDQKIIYPDIYYDYGLRLGNGITLKGSSGTHITCKYTGNNDNVKMYFSPFNTDTGGFKMINLSIECSNVRYCVHDERGIDNVPYEVLYDSCYMESSNSTEASSPWKSNACIGGGLGINGHIKVTNCVFNSIANNSILVSYHDSSGDFTVYTDERNIGYVSPQNYVICSGNYIKGQNGFGFTWNSKNGESKTRILCYGNSVGRQTHIGKESSAVVHDCDIEVLEWNNVIRNI